MIYHFFFWYGGACLPSTCSNNFLICIIFHRFFTLFNLMVFCTLKKEGSRKQKYQRDNSRAERDELFFKIMLKSPSFVLNIWFVFFSFFSVVLLDWQSSLIPAYHQHPRREYSIKILWYRIYNWIRVYAYPKSVYYWELFCTLFSVLCSQISWSLFSFLFLFHFLSNSMYFHNANKIVIK